MKILLWNPYTHPAHGLVRSLRSRGMVVLLPSSGEEAWQMLNLHGNSVDLAVIHREDVEGGNPGLGLIHRIKQDTIQSDLPVILTTEEWNEHECAEHQEGRDGANAYLQLPFEEQQLIYLIEQVIGMEVRAPAGQMGTLVTRVEARGGKTLITASVVLPSEEPDPIPEFEESPEAAMPANEDDTALNNEMPYLFGKGGRQTPPPPPAAAAEVPVPGQKGQRRFSKFFDFMPARTPVGDAVVPGGAVESPDLGTLKKYLYLREQDVAALSFQLKGMRTETGELEEKLRMEMARNKEMEHDLKSLRSRIKDFEKSKDIEFNSLNKENEDLRFEVKTKRDKARLLESKVKEAQGEIDRIKDRVRSDIRKIRVREKELENRLEILKKDSEVLVNAREGRIIELKRRLDLVEFNMDLLQNQYDRERDKNRQLGERFQKANKAMRVAEGLLGVQGEGDGDDGPEDPTDGRKESAYEKYKKQVEQKVS